MSKQVHALYRQNISLSLFGILYELRPGQSPRDILQGCSNRGEAFPEDWVWLGSPGWWADMPKERKEAVQAFMREHPDAAPENPGEFCELKDFDVTLFV